MTDKRISESSGNVFEDLELTEPGTALVKAELARRISGLLEERGLNQSEAAEILGIDQPKVSTLVRGKLAGFSTDRLLKFLVALDCDVEIAVRPSTHDTCGIRVLAENG